MIILLRVKFGIPVFSFVFLFCFFCLFVFVCFFFLFFFFFFFLGGGGGVFFSTALPISFSTLSALKSFIGLFFLNYGQNRIHGKC